MSHDLSYRTNYVIDDDHLQTIPQSGAFTGRTPSIADRFADLLAPLSPRRRRGLIARLSVGYYEGWRPGRAEVAELVAQELRRSPR